MSFHTVSFLQASFYSTTLFSKAFIHPTNIDIATPDGRSWKAVSDEILSEVGSKSLLSLVGIELNRQMQNLALEHINGWVFHSKNALAVKEKLEEAARRYARIRDELFAEELQSALKKLFLQDPRFQARLSEFDDTEEAVCDVSKRVVTQCRFTWEMGLFNIADKRSFGLRLMVLMHDKVYECTCNKGTDGDMMSAVRFSRFENFSTLMDQFRGVDERFDRALADYRKLLLSFPDDGSSLYGGGLKDFWRELTRLGDYLRGELENDFYEQPGLSDDYDEDNLYWHIESDDTLQDIVTWDQADIDTGIDIGINNDSIPTIPNINDNFDMGLDPVENFSLELTPNAF